MCIRDKAKLHLEAVGGLADVDAALDHVNVESVGGGTDLDVYKRQQRSSPCSVLIPVSKSFTTLGKFKMCIRDSPCNV